MKVRVSCKVVWLKKRQLKHKTTMKKPAAHQLKKRPAAHGHELRERVAKCRQQKVEAKKKRVAENVRARARKAVKNGRSYSPADADMHKVATVACEEAKLARSSAEHAIQEALTARTDAEEAFAIATTAKSQSDAAMTCAERMAERVESAERNMKMDYQECVTNIKQDYHLKNSLSKN